jgi:protein-tyrosine-phosphatase
VTGRASERPGAVLFVCGQNVVRSPMAAAITRHLFPRSMFVRSAGIRPGDPDPFTAAVMEEVGLDISKHRPKAIEDLEDMSFDLAITLAPEAHHRLLDLTRSQALDVEYWPIVDPTAVAGSRTQIMDAYRGVRDELERRIRARFGLPPAAPAGEDA